MSHWAPLRSFGCFVCFDTDAPTRALLDELVEGLAIGSDAKMSTKNYFLRWRKLSWKAVDTAIGDGSTLSITLLVGTPADVRLGGRVTMRHDPSFEKEWQVPLLAWVGAESERWPAPVFTAFARRWLRIAATHGAPLSGGVLVQRDLRDAKIEMTCEFESSDGEEPDKSPGSFWRRLMDERSLKEVRTKIRRVYPTTLLGPMFASQVDDAALATAGATNIERINGSVIFDAASELREAWSPEYLAATVELRRLLWPMSFQNPADDPDPPRKRRR